MFRELINPLTLKILALGRPLHEAERIAAVITVWVILLSVMMGYTLTIDGVPQQARNEEARMYGIPIQSSSVADICGIFPVATGTAGIPARTILHR